MRQKATTVSSLTTRNSLLIPNIDRPAPAERIAVFDIKLLPGRESMIDCALLFGSSVGTFEALRVEKSGAKRAGPAGRGIVCL